MTHARVVPLRNAEPATPATYVAMNQPPLLLQVAPALTPTDQPVAIQDLAWWRIPGGRPPSRPPIQTDESTSSSEYVSDTDEVGSLNDFASNRGRRGGFGGTGWHGLPRRPVSSTPHRSRDRRRRRVNWDRHRENDESAMDVDTPQIQTITSPAAAPSNNANNANITIPSRSTTTYKPPDFRGILLDSFAQGRQVFDKSLPELTGQMYASADVRAPITPTTQNDMAGTLPTPRSMSPHRVITPEEELASDAIYHHGNFKEIDLIPSLPINDPQQPQPRAMEPKMLQTRNKTPSQRTYTVVVEKWIRKEFDEGLLERFRK